MVTRDNKQICYLDFIANTLKNHGCKSYNVLVDLPKIKELSVNKTSRSKLDLSKLYSVLNRFSFQSTRKL